MRSPLPTSPPTSAARAELPGDAEVARELLVASSAGEDEMNALLEVSGAPDHDDRLPFERFAGARSV
jgi:hypothetical protein